MDTFHSYFINGKLLITRFIEIQDCLNVTTCYAQLHYKFRRSEAHCGYTSLHKYVIMIVTRKNYSTFFSVKEDKSIVGFIGKVISPKQSSKVKTQLFFSCSI